MFVAGKQTAVPGELAAIDDDHSRYYLQFLADRERAIAGERPQDEVAAISAEFLNVEQAWLWGIDRGWPEPLLVGAHTLADYLQLRGRYRDGVRLFRDAAVALDRTGKRSLLVDRLPVRSKATAAS